MSPTAPFSNRPSLAARETQGELRQRRIRHIFEVRPKPTVGRRDAAIQFDVDLSVQVDDDVGQFVRRRPQVDRPFEGLREQRRHRTRVPDHR